MSEELKPCPFCGHEFDTYVMESGEIMGSCSNIMCIAYGLFCSVEEWNTRPIEDALQKRIDELQRKLDFIETYRQEQSQIGCEE